MRLLLVEDNAEFAGVVERAARGIANCELVWTASRDRAIARLEHEHFDLVLLDRCIPTADQVLDDHQDHGWRVFQYVKERLPGLPVWFLTGAEDHDFAADLNNEHGRSADLHGRDRSEPMYLVCWKKKINDCLRRVREFSAERDELARIAVRSAEGLNLRPEEDSILRTFARRYHGAAIDLMSLNGGLSRSRVLKVVVRNANNGALIAAAAKVATLPDILDEHARYRSEISRLTAGGFPPLTMNIEVGAGNYGGLFYGMVGEQVESLFARLAVGAPDVALVPARLRAIEQPWYQGKQLESLRVGQIRRHMIGDAGLHEVRHLLGELDIECVENRQITVARCTQHCDAHCANVVFAQGGAAMLIDNGDAGPAFASLDPVTLELSTIFHSQHTLLPAAWPTEALLGTWTEPDQYGAGCAFEPFVKACRAWAFAEAGSPEEVVAVAYAYAMRQLKYGDTNKPFALSLIRCCIARLTAN